MQTKNEKIFPISSFISNFFKGLQSNPILSKQFKVTRIFKLLDNIVFRHTNFSVGVVRNSFVTERKNLFFASGFLSKSVVEFLQSFSKTSIIPFNFNSLKTGSITLFNSKEFFVSKNLESFSNEK